MKKIIPLDQLRRKKQKQTASKTNHHASIQSHTDNWFERSKAKSFLAKSIEDRMNELRELLIEDEFECIGEQSDQEIYSRTYHIYYAEEPTETAYLQLRMIVLVEQGSITSMYLTDDGVIDFELRMENKNLEDGVKDFPFLPILNDLIVPLQTVLTTEQISNIGLAYLNILERAFHMKQLPADFGTISADQIPAITLIKVFLHEKAEWEADLEEYSESELDEEEDMNRVERLNNQYHQLVGMAKGIDCMGIPLRPQEELPEHDDFDA